MRQPKTFGLVVLKKNGDKWFRWYLTAERRAEAYRALLPRFLDKKKRYSLAFCDRQVVLPGSMNQ